MAALTENHSVLFPEDYDAQGEYETPFRGYLSDVIVQTRDGSRYRLFFIDPTRLQQELAEQTATGRAYFTEPNLVVLPEVTTESIRRTVDGLVRDGYFQHLRPL
jgi:hypothetical protein